MDFENNDYDHITRLVQKWIADGCQDDLIKVVDREIAKSKEQLKKKIELLSRDVNADRQFLQDQNHKARDAASDAVKKMDQLEREVIPLLDHYLHDLLSLEQMSIEKQEHDQKVKDSIEKEMSVSEKLDLQVQEVIPVDNQGEDVDIDLLVKAKKLIVQDVFEDMTVGSMEEEDEQRDETSFTFPVCQVSKSCLAVIDLVMQLLDEAEFCEDQDKKNRLIKTSFKVLYLFSVCFPTKFKEEVDSIPTATALFHNNCMFTAHFILTCPTIRDVMEDKATNYDFAGLLKKFRLMGETVMKECVSQHKHRIIDYFQAPEVLQSLVEVDVKNPSLKAFESAVKKSLLLLKKLQSGWMKVLPLQVYNQMISSLMTVILEEIMNLILIVEDFSASTSDALVLIMKSLRNDFPSLLQEPHEGLASLVPNAFQFLELERLLSSSLSEIVNRWGSGFGPLSVAFSTLQVRRLIRALFQNNQLRANALDKIQDL
jgi:hypothetical protein